MTGASTGEAEYTRKGCQQVVNLALVLCLQAMWTGRRFANDGTFAW